MKGLRMYFFVMYNLSGIQKGIQVGHAAVEYQLDYGNKKLYKEFAKNHKTFIVLDGGGSNDMLERERELIKFKMDFASFQEPDLNNSVSAIAFIVPEDVYGMDISKYENDPDLEWLQPKIYKDLQFARYLKSFRLASN
jgi:hypothetical protein